MSAQKLTSLLLQSKKQKKYDRALDPGSYASIKLGVLGIGKQRDYILDHFGPGSNVVMIDDDIATFLHGYEEYYKLNLHRAIQKGFELSEAHGCYMWGLNNTSNTFRMQRRTYTVGWCFFQGPFMAFRVRDDMRLHPDFHQVKEDVQYSLMHCERDNKVLRINSMGVKPKPYFKEPGGLQTHMSTSEREAAGLVNQEYLQARYARYISKWELKDPHPRMARSPQHKVYDLSAEDLFY